MRVWLITIGEPLPPDGPDVRLLRTGLLAGELSERGHEVTWWTSAFDHTHKRRRPIATDTVQTSAGYTVRLLSSPGYRRNVSLARFRDHWVLARHFAQAARQAPRPDVIVCSWPTIELCRAAVRYGRPRGVPVLLDVRDLWPDLFVEVLPRALRPLARLALAPYAAMARRTLREGSAFTGVTQAFVSWALAQAGRPASPLDRAFAMGYTDEMPPPEALRAAAERWDEAGVREGGFVVCFFGTLGRNFDLAPVIEAARQLQQEGSPVQFVICGDGEWREHYQRMAANCANVRFSGWVGRSDIAALMQRAAVGLAPYVDSVNFHLNLPNKPIEYLSAGLPVLSSIDGALGTLLRDADCGMTYADAEELAQAIRRLHGDAEMKTRMARNAIDLYRRQFVARDIYGKMARHIEQMCATMPSQ